MKIKENKSKINNILSKQLAVLNKFTPCRQGYFYVYWVLDFRRVHVTRTWFLSEVTKWTPYNYKRQILEYMKSIKHLLPQIVISSKNNKRIVYNNPRSLN